MQLGDVLNIHGKIDWRQAIPQTEVKAIAFDSRKVDAGTIYVAIRGTEADGHRYVADAANQGAIAIIVEDVSVVPDFFQGAVVNVLDSRLSLQAISQNFYSNPGDHLYSVAVTGTNGKTSVSYILEHMLNSLRFSCGVIGTIDHHFKSRSWPSELTTPDPVTLQERLKEFVDFGAKAFVIEASSHALKQGRLKQGIDIAIFTNFSRDHLDYHQTLEDYFKSKARLFTKSMMKEGRESLAVINGDDIHGEQLAVLTPRTSFLFGEGENCDFRFRLVSENLKATKFMLTFPNGKAYEVVSPLLGKHNIYNYVAAIACVYLMNLDYKEAIASMKRFPGIPGRMQKVGKADHKVAFVDYAHTDDALRNVLGLIARLTPEGKRLITVFGCGGDRDKGKRSFMGRVAFELSDTIIVTSDNPRSEDPQSIIDDILEGLPLPSERVIQEVDRKKAIEMAVDRAKPGDVIVVAGKGHEDYQIIGGQRHHFSDYEILKSLLTVIDKEES